MHTYLNGDKCRHFYVFKSFFIQCNYLLARGYPMFHPLCIQIHVCHVGSTHVRTNRLFLIPRTNINYSQTIRAEYRKYLFIRSTGVQPLRSSNWEHWAIRTSSTSRDISWIKYFLNNSTVLLCTDFVNAAVRFHLRQSACVWFNEESEQRERKRETYEKNEQSTFV